MQEKLYSGGLLHSGSNCLYQEQWDPDDSGLLENIMWRKIDTLHALVAGAYLGYVLSQQHFLMDIEMFVYKTRGMIIGVITPCFTTFLSYLILGLCLRHCQAQTGH